MRSMAKGVVRSCTWLMLHVVLTAVPDPNAVLLMQVVDNGQLGVLLLPMCVLNASESTWLALPPSVSTFKIVIMCCVML